MKFPVLAIDPDSFAHLFRNETELERIPMFYIGLFRKRRATLEFFDSGGCVWKLENVEAATPIPIWRRILPSIRDVDVTIRFQALGECPLDRMKEIFRKAVETDSDILTQNQEREDILTKLSQTKSVGEVFRLYRWMTKDFFKGPNQSPQPGRTSRPTG